MQLFGHHRSVKSFGGSGEREVFCVPSVSKSPEVKKCRLKAVDAGGGVITAVVIAAAAAAAATTSDMGGEADQLHKVISNFLVLVAGLGAGGGTRTRNKNGKCKSQRGFTIDYTTNTSPSSTHHISQKDRTSKQIVAANTSILSSSSRNNSDFFQSRKMVRAILSHEPGLPQPLTPWCSAHSSAICAHLARCRFSLVGTLPRADQSPRSKLRHIHKVHSQGHFRSVEHGN
ncbi:hypothetical protein PoB_006819600 [Plakobranchus ocellatus]|uniref:Uncharacterized protein n=1 Tax=Plakobranchus ocellatus TaxID=259542 RepID=A0AAV4DCA0_9GAST|nr:hypothetical protein PoB_006819600 [Plakobranchus ocellatus]